jgi:hypothetical protein
MRIGDYVTHPAADAFPLMAGDEFKSLVADIKANGLRESIWRCKGKGEILDGRNRLRGCFDAGVRPRFREYDGDDPIGFVVSLNISRRHLNESQRAIVAAKLATMPSGRPSKAGKSAGFRTLGESASLLNVGERTARDARAVISHAVPELVQAVEQGDLSVTAAAELAQLAPEVQREAARNAREKSGAHLIRKARSQSEQGGERSKDPRRAAPPLRPRRAACTWGMPARSTSSISRVSGANQRRWPREGGDVATGWNACSLARAVRNASRAVPALHLCAIGSASVARTPVRRCGLRDRGGRRE